MKVGWPPGGKGWIPTKPIALFFSSRQRPGSRVWWIFERLLYEPSFLNVAFPKFPEEVRIPATTTGPRHGPRITNQLIQLEVEQALYQAPGDLKAVATQVLNEGTLNHRATYPTTSGGMVYEPSLLSSILWNYPGYSANFLFAYLSELGFLQPSSIRSATRWPTTAFPISSTATWSRPTPP